MSAVVVDLPLVPVIAMNGAFGAIFARSRQNSSMSPMISTPAARASFADQSSCRRSSVSMPLEAASATFAGLSSQAVTRAPPSFKASAVATKHEIVLAVIGGLFVLEAVSVIVQVVSFKLTGKRVFKMAPIHHHFEQLGWTEPQIVIRFWIVAFVLALAGLSTLKLR